MKSRIWKYAFICEDTLCNLPSELQMSFKYRPPWKRCIKCINKLTPNKWKTKKGKFKCDFKNCQQDFEAVYYAWNYKKRIYIYFKFCGKHDEKPARFFLQEIEKVRVEIIKNSFRTTYKKE